MTDEKDEGLPVCSPDFRCKPNLDRIEETSKRTEEKLDKVITFIRGPLEGDGEGLGGRVSSLERTAAAFKRVLAGAWAVIAALGVVLFSKMIGK